MVYVGNGNDGFCIDRYEVSVGSSCVHTTPKNKGESDDNLTLPQCNAAVTVGAAPWTHITRQQAELACARLQKRLPTTQEWYQAALGTLDKNSKWTDADCNVDSAGPVATGSREHCVSAAGVYDMIGNVWEWQQETVLNGVYNGRELPGSGYIVSIDENGMPIEDDASVPDDSLFADYFWIDKTGVRGIFRGGYWRSQSDAGQYAVNITVDPSFTGSAIGFRCAKDIEK
jgi:formylglycine-generating enzyme required for sulfatase activity